MIIEKDIQGLPDVDLGPILKDMKATAEPAREPVTEPQKQDFGQFKTPEDLLRGYKEIQGYTTKVSQENKALKDQIAQINEQLEMAKLSQQYIPPQYAPPVAPYQSPADEPIEAKIDRMVAIREIANVLEEEAEKNSTEFQERYNYAQMLSRQYPVLGRTPRGVKKLFEMGDKLRQENMKRNAGKALESIFGEPLGQEEIARLRTMVKGEKAITQQNYQTNAYMPETSTSTKSGQDQNRIPNVDFKLKESVKQGDVDGTIEAVFEKLLAE